MNRRKDGPMIVGVEPQAFACADVPGTGSTHSGKIRTDWSMWFVVVSDIPNGQKTCHHFGIDRFDRS